MYTIPSDIIGVIATFLPEDIEAQRPLMLVNHTWFQGVIGQDGMKPKPTIKWPLNALHERDSAKLYISDCTGTDMSNLAQVHPRVRGLFLDNRTTTEALLLLANKNSGFECLTDLGLFGCDQLTNDVFECLTGNGKLTKQLTTLQLYECGKVSSALSCLERFPALTDLDIGKTGGDCWDFLVPIAKLSNLTTLTLDAIPSDRHLANCITQCPALTTLSLTFCRSVDEQLERLVQLDLPQLSTLDVSFSSLTDKGMAYISKMRQLTSLDLARCLQLTESALAHLPGSFDNLTSLHLGVDAHDIPAGVSHEVHR